MSNSSSLSLGNLERGKACLRCRRRKMKCDGTRPTCGPCARASEPECEFTDAGPALSQLLEQSVARLEARIRQLEERKTVSRYETGQEPDNSRSPSADWTPPNVEHNDNRGEVFRVPQTLLDSFTDNAIGFGFFLNIPRFLAALSSQEDDEKVPRVLLYIVKLIGLVCTRERSLKQQEPHTLSLAIESIAATMVGRIQADRLLYVLQAELLLSNYFFYRNRTLEGGYHLSAAVSIALSGGFHQIRRTRGGNGRETEVQHEYKLPPPVDDIQVGERINGFWTVFSFERCWSTVLGPQSAFSREAFLLTHISTPWPLDMVDYEQKQLPEFVSSPTLGPLLNKEGLDIPMSSLIVKRVASTILLNKAVELSSNYSHYDAQYLARFHELDRKIELFTKSLLMVSVANSSDSGPDTFSYTRLFRPETARFILLTNMVAYCAVIKLHEPVPQDWSASRNKVLNAAVDAANILRHFDISALTFVDPFIGALWSTIVQTLARALQGLRSARGATTSTKATVISSLSCVISAMESVLSTDPSALFVDHTLQTLLKSHPDLQGI